MADLTPENYWPLGSTVQKTITSLADTDHYRHFGLISVNPINGHAVLIYRYGEFHVGSGDYGKIYIRHSPDGGTNWDINDMEITFFTETGVDLRNIAGGYDSNGRLFVFYSTCNPNTNPVTWLKMKYNYSNDDGASWELSSPDNELPCQIEVGVNVFSPYGHIVDIGNNTLYQTWHEGIQAIQGNPSQYRIYIYKSTDRGQSFPEENIITISPNLHPWGEASMVNVGGGCFIALARHTSPTEGGGHYHQFWSEDNCVTWQGELDDDIIFEPDAFYPAPAWLSFINYEGVGIVACYYTKRMNYPYNNPPEPSKLKIVFGLPKDLLDNSIYGWNHSTKKEIIPGGTGTYRSGYQSFFLPLNQYKGIGVYFKEDGNGLAYPIIVFTNIVGMMDVLIALGL